MRGLKDYVGTKIHPLVKSRNWHRITIRGHYVRDGENVHVSSLEKKKGFNWQRPTATIIDENTLEISCFPGRDYVLHYAKLLAADLALRKVKRSTTTLEYILPSTEECMDILLKSNLKHLDGVDTLVLGYVGYLSSTKPPAPSAPWETGDSVSGSDGSTQLFAWRRFTRPDGTKIAFLASKMSLWGDIIGNVVRAQRQLSKTSVTSVIYMGKVGALKPEDKPYASLATGHGSFIDGSDQVWNSALDATISTFHFSSSTLKQGKHINVASPLDETKTWFGEWKSKASWVDCEVGYLAQACEEGKAQFGYLHFISDNVDGPGGYTLGSKYGNEKGSRKTLLGLMRWVLADYLDLDVLRRVPLYWDDHSEFPDLDPECDPENDFPE
ncbi:hypothetical protein NUU61_003022 [Penicillium alfredii]|uniref:Uncharacterized protein n=1 Tax=Penicillium alfredii TaxID=1506179 RepID=A0A9W9KGK0_9EURO|nr:uncharacterized protein NUU61_003022 [Penicillium alfredii]KAJ5105675.1 hypothetical protein NUU61_003022 [Penicillium alfredii]